MSVLFKIFCLMSFLFVTACGGGHKTMDYGKTTRSDLLAQRGEPIKVESIPVEEGSILFYPENHKFQLKNDIVTHGFKEPIGDEKNLLYWKHKFKNCLTITRKISDPVSHELPEHELKCASMGVSVIFKEGSEFITRIIEYEKE